MTNLRAKYLEIAREYLKQRPDFIEKTNEIKNNLKKIGVSEEEFSEVYKDFIAAYKKIGILEDSKVKRKEDNWRIELNETEKTFFNFKLFLISIVALILFSEVLVYYKFITEKITEINKSTIVRKINIFKKEEQALPKTYATSSMIDVEKTFSYSPEKLALKFKGKPKKEVFGFFPYWILEKADQVNIDAVTTVALFGLDVNGRGDINTNDGGWAMWENPKIYAYIKTLRKKKIRVVLTFKSFNNDNIEKLVLSDQAQENLISNAINLMNSKSLDGLNLDFEYIGTPNPKIRDEFSRFITNLYIEMKTENPGSSLTIDTYVHSAANLRLFDIQYLENQNDAFVIMGYDFHVPSGSPGPVAPFEGELSILTQTNAYLDKVSSKKLILALPFYGYDWPTQESSIDRAKSLSYGELAFLSNSNSISWDQTSQSPFYYYTNPDTKVKHVVHFENPKSLGIKFDFINKKNLKGVGIWALGYDGLSNDLEQLLLEKFGN